MRRRKRRQRPDDLISAQEIACWAYCPEAWRRQYGLGLPPTNRAAMEAGTRHHARKAVAERVAGGFLASGRLLALAAALMLLLLWLVSR